MSLKRFFCRIIKYHPSKYQGYEGLAKIYQKRLELDRAISQWWLIIEKFPGLKHAYNSLGLLFIEKNRFEIAWCVYKDALEKHPGYVSAYEGLLKVKKAIGDNYDEVIQILERDLEKVQDADDVLKVLLSAGMEKSSFKCLYDKVVQGKYQKFAGAKSWAFLAEQAELYKNWESANQAWILAIRKNPKNELYQYRYGKTLRYTVDSNTMLEYFKEKAIQMPESFAMHKGVLEAANIERQWQVTIDAIELIKQFGTPAQIAEAYFLGRMAYHETKQLELFDNELHDYLAKHSEYYKAWKAYTIVPTLKYNGNQDDLLLAVERSKILTEKFPHVIEAWMILGQNHLANNNADEAEKVFDYILSLDPQHVTALKYWTICPTYSANWDEAIKRMDVFKRRFPSSFYQVFYAYIYALHQQNDTDIVKNEFVQYMGKYFHEEVRSNPFWFTNERHKITNLLSLMPKRNLQYTLEQIVDRLDALPIINPNNIHRIILNDPKSDVLVVCFSGMDGKRTNALYQEEGVESFSKVAAFKPTEDEYDFVGFAKGAKQYNFLLLKDNYNCWYQIHTQMYIEIISQIVKKHNIKKLVCIGTSAGGFAALFFGQLLKAHLVFAYGPQTFAWTNHGAKYHKMCEILLNAGVRRYNSIAQLQKDGEGFIPKTFIHFGKNCTIDLFSQIGLDEMDQNLHIIRHDSDKHAMHQVIGKRKMFTDICSQIEVYQVNHECLMDHNVNSHVFKNWE